MGIELYAAREIEAIARASQCAADVLAELLERIEVGISTLDLDRWAREAIARRGARPSPLGFHGYPAAICTSVGEVVCHGIPSADRVLTEGDIINVDVTTELDGFHGDTSATVCVGRVGPEVRRLVDQTRRALDAGIAEVRPGARLGDVGAAIEDVARSAELGLVRDFCGHGIGRRMHQPPQVPHHGPAGRGLRLRPGMVFTIEPMLTPGRPDVRILDDGWTAVTTDGRWSAQFEHTLAVTSNGCEVLTRRPDDRGVR